MENKPTIEEEIVKMLRTVYDPEIPVNIYDLGLIYNIEENDGTVKIEMTLTAPNCPAADFIIEDVQHPPLEGGRAMDQLFFFYAHFTPVLPTPPVRTPSAWSSSMVRYFVKIPCATRSPLFTWNGSSFVL